MGRASVETGLRALGLHIGETIADRYRLDRPLGSGAMGFVVRAVHLRLDEPVAIKFLARHQLGDDPEVAARFDREAKLATKIKSEHVARVLDYGTIGGDTPYIVMEHLDGETLGELLARRVPVAIPDAVDYVLQTCAALAHAHALGIVHRDLKPDNLFLTRRPDGSACIKVLDFGISKTGRDSSLTESDAAMGSPAYMSPEQWVSAKEADERSDVWSLGAILYELLTGTLPFDGDTMPEVCRAVLDTEPRPLRVERDEIPLPLERAVLWCLKKIPAERCPDVAELGAELVEHGSFAGQVAFDRTVGVLRSAPASRHGAAGAPSSSRAAVDAKAATLLGTAGPAARPSAATRPLLWAGLVGVAIAAAAVMVLTRAPSEIPPGSEQARPATGAEGVGGDSTGLPPAAIADAGLGQGGAQAGPDGAIDGAPADGAAPSTTSPPAAPATPKAKPEPDWLYGDPR